MSDFTIPNLFDVKGKIAVVTGGGSGLGTMIASAYVQNGAKVYIASRKEQQLKEVGRGGTHAHVWYYILTNLTDVPLRIYRKVSEKLNKIGPGSCEYVVADLSSKVGCHHLVETIKAKEEKIHILVNNSGITWGAPYYDFPEKAGWDRVLSLNVKSIFYVTAGFTPLLAKNSNNRDPARVINISSIAALSPIADRSRLAGEGNGLWSYHTSKAAVNHLTSQLAVTLGPKFITVNAICPGVFPTKMTAFGFKNAGGAKEVVGGHPWGRVGEPTDIAGVALFLASPASTYVTGAHLTVDGGGLISGLTGARL